MYIIKVVPTAQSINTGSPTEMTGPKNLLSLTNQAIQKQADASSKKINKPGIQGLANHIFVLNLLIDLPGKKTVPDNGFLERF